MKIKKILFILVSTLSFQSLADTKSLIIAENKQIMIQEGEINERHAPCSSFKIALSLMGYNDGILQTETTPKWKFKKGYTDSIDLWKQDHDPILWMKHSCVWFSQVLTQKLGMQKFKQYVKNFDYGNQDVSGDKGKNNGLTRSWLSSSLQISPKEQLDFLVKLIDNKLPVSAKAHQMTKNILFIEDLDNGWKFYGKTGCGDLLKEDGTHDTNNHLGWFVGWIENVQQNRKIIIVHYREDAEKEYLGGKRARELSKERLLEIIKK